MHQRCQQGKAFGTLNDISQPFKLPFMIVVFFMYILTEGGRSFKTLLKENYAIVLGRCYLFTKKCYAWD